jgi:tetratricopeptide (TPR) repeat protein
MAERIEEPEAQAATEAGADPISAAAAMAIGLRKGRAGQKSDPEFDAFLKMQTDLLRIQKEHLHEQRELILSRLRWGRFSDRMKAAIQVLTVLVGLAVATVLGVLAWQAHEDHGVAIEAFSVPPDFAQKGLTGQVIAGQVLDRLAQLQAQTVTARPASTYANDWGEDIRVVIPETGVSIGELNRWLKQWLGSATRISGEVVRTPSGIAVTVRARAAAGRRFEGPEADLDRLIQQASEDVYAQTQPYRHAVYLQSSGRTAEAQREYARLAEDGSAEDRPWALGTWGMSLVYESDYRDAAEKGREAIQAAPDLFVGYRTAYSAEQALSHREAVLAILRQAKRRLRVRGAGAFPAESLIARELGDFRAAEAKAPPGPLDVEGIARQLAIPTVRALGRAQEHDVSGARAALARIDPATGEQSSMRPSAVEAACRYFLEDWTGVIALPPRSGRDTTLTPGRAFVYSLAKLGRLQEAQALLAAMPQDCDDCVLARGMVAAVAHDWTEADRRFAEVTLRAPSSPFAPMEWGRALLAKGDIDGAIEKLAEAHRRSPHFADPTELWGEALLKKGDLGHAVAKFHAADQYAPRWGRNHMLWGEALMLQGRYREARAQYEMANGLDLSKPDRAALDVLLARTASGVLHG